MKEEDGKQGEKPFAWTPRMEELLADWRSRVYAAQSAYYEVAEKYRRQNYLLGIPVVVVSSLVGTAIFADWNKVGILKWWVGSVSLLAAVLASLQTFLKFGESATQHGAAADWFAAIRREIDETMALPPEMRGDPKRCLDSIRQEINKASQKSPELSERSWKNAALRFGVNESPHGFRPRQRNAGRPNSVVRTSRASSDGAPESGGARDDSSRLALGNER